MKQRQQICDLLIAGKRWTAAALIKTDELATVERYKGKTSEVSAVNLNSIRTNVLLHSGKSFTMKRREKREEKVKDKGRWGDGVMILSGERGQLVLGKVQPKVAELRYLIMVLR